MKNKYESDLLCQVERGLWTPELCLVPALATCSNCQRPICKEHLKKDDMGTIKCVPCFITEKHANETNFEQNPYTYQDVAWYYFERMRYQAQNKSIDFNRNDYNSFNYRNTFDIDTPIEHKDTFFDS